LTISTRVAKGFLLATADSSPPAVVFRVPRGEAGGRRCDDPLACYLKGWLCVREVVSLGGASDSFSPALPQPQAAASPSAVNISTALCFCSFFLFFFECFCWHRALLFLAFLYQGFFTPQNNSGNCLYEQIKPNNCTQPTGHREGWGRLVEHECRQTAMRCL
jgi:hypothetical protein